MIEADIRAAVGGDVQALDRVNAEAFGHTLTPPEGIALVLTADAVRHVLRELGSGTARSGQVQRWASFMRRGYASTQNGLEPTRALQIDYEQPKEDAIVEVIGRLDQLGDLIDGHITSEELAALEALLDAPTG